VEQLIGRSPDGLQLAERVELAGKWIALELYTPETLPLRQITVMADSAEECIRQLAKSGLDPTQFELQLVPQPY
jgi:hypothetical protein